MGLDHSHKEKSLLSVVFLINIEKNEFEINVDSQQNNGINQFSFWIGPNIDISSHMAK